MQFVLYDLSSSLKEVLWDWRIPLIVQRIYILHEFCSCVDKKKPHQLSARLYVYGSIRVLITLIAHPRIGCIFAIHSQADDKVEKEANS